ncbi:hypothetical protein NEMIN01_1580 [Nematocida minor]|uniref:uncharacterized protein n=1 Tax=Nematocida minor TaxID=1912983 RepID=UPI00221FDB63|nr:uncharacterized protein NEMIN01_1580 [Nematocida minor]KAI5191596.1 hypothetical protein NEMIN01_1580 [Nematocida minor]
MILKRTLKQVIIGAAALGCLQKAHGLLYKDDVQNIASYWSDRISHFDKEITLRNEFSTKFRALSSKEAFNMDASMERHIETEKTSMDAIMEEFESFKEEANNLIDITKSLDSYNRSNDDFFDTEKNKEVTLVMLDNLDALKRLVVPALNKNTSLTEKINKYDSYMVKVIEKCAEEEDTNNTLQNKTLFKLAKNNKIVAADVIYMLYLLDLSKLQGSALDNELIESVYAKIISHGISRSNVELFIAAIKRDVTEGNINVFVSGDMHFHLLFGVYSSVNTSKSSLVDEKTMDIYLSLLKENISEEEVKEHKEIAPVQVMKVIVVEYLIGGHLMDHKSNTLFRNLGKIVENVFNPANYNSTDIHEGLRMGREKQDEILDILSYIWCVYDEDRCVSQQAYDLYKEIGIGYSEFKEIKTSFASTKWMYQGVAAPLAGSDEQCPNISAVQFDISYTNPLWYVCRRCKHIKRPDNNKNINFKLIDEYENGQISFYSYKIYDTENELIWAKYMEGCIKACSSSILITSKPDEDESKVYFNILSGFYKYLKI